MNNVAEVMILVYIHVPVQVHLAVHAGKMTGWYMVTASLTCCLIFMRQIPPPINLNLLCLLLYSTGLIGVHGSIPGFVHEFWSQTQWHALLTNILTRKLSLGHLLRGFNDLSLITRYIFLNAFYLYLAIFYISEFFQLPQTTKLCFYIFVSLRLLSHYICEVSYMAIKLLFQTHLKKIS